MKIYSHCFTIGSGPGPAGVRRFESGSSHFSRAFCWCTAPVSISIFPARSCDYAFFRAGRHRSVQQSQTVHRGHIHRSHHGWGSPCDCGNLTDKERATSGVLPGPAGKMASSVVSVSKKNPSVFLTHIPFHHIFYCEEYHERDDHKINERTHVIPEREFQGADHEHCRLPAA